MQGFLEVLLLFVRVPVVSDASEMLDALLFFGKGNLSKESG